MKATYANVVSTLALILAAAGGGTAVAASVAKGSVGTSQLRNNAVTSAKIRANAVGGREVKNSSLGGADIANGSLGGADIANHSLGGIDIADQSLGGAQIADGSLSGTQIADNSITSADIADGTISSADIADQTISHADISPESLQFADLAPDAAMQLSRVWSPNPITTGTMSGFGVVTDTGAGGVTAVSFPMAAPLVPTVEALGDAAHCTGSFDDPTAPSVAQGAVCVYLDPDASDTAAASVEQPTASTSRRGIVLVRDASADSTPLQFTWAYTAPGE